MNVMWEAARALDADRVAAINAHPDLWVIAVDFDGGLITHVELDWRQALRWLYEWCYDEPPTLDVPWQEIEDAIFTWFEDDGDSRGVIDHYIWDGSGYKECVVNWKELFDADHA